MNKKSNTIQILLETMTRCGGNCSGCALSSVERMDTLFDYEHFVQNSTLVQKKLSSFNASEIEAVTVFLGQGDHFLMPEEHIEDFVKQCSIMVPNEFKQKTVVFITASAIGKESVIRKKMDLFYQYSIQYGIPFFIQTVFDPKKIKITQKFKEIYLRNILYFKEKCGMTEITVNLGQDLIEYISPTEFHNWIKEHEFNHIELNWVINQFTFNMWKKSYQDMHKWLKEWLLIYRDDAVYEINFLPFMARHFKWQNMQLLHMNRVIQNELNHNFYFDYDGQEFLCQYGFVSNLTPFGKRLESNPLALTDSNRLAKKILGSLMKNEKCASCEFKSVCSISAVESTVDLWNEFKIEKPEIGDCPWNIYDFMHFFKTEILDFIKTNPNKEHIIYTTFTKNPIQNKNIVLELQEGDVDNSTFEYFDECRLQRIKNEQK